MKITEGNIPIYRQIIDYFEIEIASGLLQPGSKIDSIRALAMKFKVNPNTVQKALLELERDGYLYTDRTNGKFVTEDDELIKSLKYTLVKTLTLDFLEGVKKLGFTYEEISEYLKEKWEVQNGSNHSD